ncbi:hypothetical protein BOX15_Mlig018476g1, partial [Macrostomum lignano]
DLLTAIAAVRVSSVLNRNNSEFGKRHLTDRNPETCWNSDQGAGQWIELALARPSRLLSLQLQFQGGFSATRCLVAALPGDGEPQLLADARLSDSSQLQSLNLAPGAPPVRDRIRLTFLETADPFGRVTVYQLGGTVLPC